jgi:hypothetical protein
VLEGEIARRRRAGVEVLNYNIFVLTISPPNKYSEFPLPYLSTNFSYHIPLSISI